MIKILGVLVCCVAAMALFYAVSFGVGYTLGYILPEGNGNGGNQI